MGKKVLIRMLLLPGLNDDPAGLEAGFAMLKRHKGPTSRAWNCCPNRYGEGKYRQLGQATLAENPIRRSVWRNSRPFSRPGARRD